jgi:hypothetical protein
VRLATTIRRLSPASLIAVHHDLVGDPFDPQLLQPIGEAHMAPERTRVEWGHFTIVDAILRTTAWLLQNFDFEWLIILSGQDYPLTPLGPFESELRSGAFDAYFEHFEAHDPSHWPEGTAFQRYYFQYLRLPRNPYFYKLPGALRQLLTWGRRAINAHQGIVRVMPRMRNSPAKLGIRSLRPPFSSTFPCWGGQNHLNLSRKCVVAIQRFAQERPEIVDYYRNTYLPEESFVHTTLLNLEFRVSPEMFRYVHWGNAKHAASPGVIRRGDIAAAIASKKPFGRKFDTRVDPTALDEVDRLLGI